MDPKLQYFLDATGWSKEDLIRKLSAGENTESTAITEIDCVTSTTSYKINCTPQKNINKLPSFSAALARQIKLTNPYQKSKIQTGNIKTSKHIDTNTEIINVDLDCNESVLQHTLSSSLTEDLLCHLNTNSSYLPPLCYLQSPKRCKVDQSAVIDLVSDTESLDPQENNSDRQGKDEAVIDISTDSDDSVKSESFNHQVSDVGDVRAKKSNNFAQFAESANKSKSTESRNEPIKSNRLVNNRLKDRDHNSDDPDLSSKSLHRQDRNGSEHSGKDTSRYQERHYRHRSSSSNRHGDDRQHRKTARNSRSRSRSRSRPRRYRSRSERSRSRSRSRRRTRDRNRNESHSRRVSSGSRSNRSKSKSVDRGYKYSRKRSRSRSRSRERDAEWQSKISKTTDKFRTRRRPVYSAEDMQRINVHTSYYGKEISPPKHLNNDFAVSAESTMALKDVALRLMNGTYKKRKSLPDQLNISNDLSENKNAHSNTFVTFKNIASEENPEISSKQKRPRNKSFESTGADIVHRMNQSAKKFIESKEKNLASEVSQLISTDISEGQSSNNSMLTKHKNDSLGSNDAIIIDKDLLLAKRMDETNNSSKVKTTNISSNKVQYHTNIFDSERSGFYNQLNNKIDLNISEDATLTMLNAEKKRLEEALMRESEDNIQQKTLTNIISGKVDIILSKKTNNTVSTSIKSKPLPSKSISEISCEDAPIKIVNIPKSRHTSIDNLSDISDCTSDQLADEVEIIAKKSCSSNIISDNDKKKCSVVPTFSNAKMLLLENIPKDNNSGMDNKSKILKSNIFDLGDLSDLSDYSAGDITDDMDAPITVSTIQDNPKDLHYPNKNNCTESEFVVNDDLKIYNTTIDLLTYNAKIKLSTDLSENGRNEIVHGESFHITTAEETSKIFSSSDEIKIDDQDDKSVKCCVELLKGDNDIDNIVHSQESQPSLAEDPLVKSRDKKELMEQPVESQSSTAENVSALVKYPSELSIDKKELIKKPVASQPTIAEDVSAPINCLSERSINDKENSYIFTELMKPTEDLPIQTQDEIISNSQVSPQLEVSSKISDNPSELPTHETETALQPIEDLSTNDHEKIGSRSQLESLDTDDNSEVLNIASSSMKPREDLPIENDDEIISNSKLLLPISDDYAKGYDCLLTENVESTKHIEYLTENGEDEVGNSEQEHFSIIEDISKSVCPSANTQNSPMESIEDISENAPDEIVNSLDSHNSTTEDSEVADDPTVQLIEDFKEGIHMELVETDAQIHQQNLCFEVETKADKMALENSHSEIAVIEDVILETIKIKNNNSPSEMHNKVIEVDNANAKVSKEQDQQNLSVSLKDSNETIGLELTKKASKNCRESELIDPDSYFNDSESNSLPNGIQNIHDSVMYETEIIQNVTPVKRPTDNIEKTDLVQKSIIEAEKSTTTEHISEISDDDTPSLDIEAILKKCKDDQERALNKPQQEGPEDKVLSSVMRVRPKNRRPNFSSLRDKSISTIHINMLLEKLSYNDMRPGTSASSSVLQKDNDGNNLTSKDSSANGNLIERPISIQSKSSDSKVVEKLKTSEKTLSKTNITKKEFKDLDKSLYDKNANDNIRIEILKQLDILRNQRNDAAFTTSINRTTIPKGIRKKTFAKLRDPITDHKDDEEIEEINIINDNLNSPIIWLTKTTDYKKIKGWKNKSMGIKSKKCSPPAMNTIAEDFAVPSCSFHYPSVVDDIIENVVADNLDEIQTEYADHTDPNITEDAEKNAFSSSMLDEFLLDKSEVELKISYEVPMLLMGPKIDSSPKVDENLLKGDMKYRVEPLIKYESITKEGNKPRTLAEKRKLFLQEHKPVKTSHSVAKQSISKPFENYRNLNRSVIKRSVNDDLPNTGHNKRKDFAVGSVYWKGRKYVVPCREKRTIYFRAKIGSRYSQLISNNSKEEMVTILNPNDSSPVRNEGPPKAILWSPDKMVRKPIVRSIIKSISYKAGPMCKKPELILGTTNFWKCIVKPLPKIFLEITAEFGKSLHPRALQFLYAESEVNLSKDKVEFALTALKDSKPTKYRLPVSYDNGQTQFTLRQRHIIETRGTKIPPVCGDISSEVQEIVDDLLTCLEIQAIQDTVIKDDPDFETEEPSKQMTKSPSKKDTKESPVTTKVAGINRQLRLALGRLQVKFIDINIDEDEDPNIICDKTYCQLGCVCSSLIGALPSKEHCRRIECVFGCICGYKPPINTTVTLPAGSDLDLFSTVDKLQSEATKNLAKVEKEFTQTIVCTKNETYVLGDTVDRRRRCTRAPKKYENFLEAIDAAKNNEEQKHSKESHSEHIRNIYGVDIMECSVRIEKVDMYHIIPFCWRHELYQCQCLKEFLIARSQDKANNLALQLGIVQANKNDNDCTIQGLLGSTWSKLAMRKKVKKIKRKFSHIKRFELKLKPVKSTDVTNKTKTSKALNIFYHTLKSPENYVETINVETDISKISESSDLVTINRPNISVPKLIQENHQSKSSRRKQVLSTMVDVNEKATIQVRKLRDPIQSKKPINNKLKQNFEPDFLRFLVPTSNVRLQFLKMLRKPADAKDEFRLLSFMLLSNRFNRRLFHVWYAPTATTSKYILTMDSMRPSPEFKNVRFIGADFKTDNYLIQWLMEGSIPMTAVQDFLVILRVIASKKYEICGMCEKSKIEYTDEPLPSLVQTSPVSMPQKIPVGSSVPYNVNGSAQQERKILNIQNKKIPTITCTYPSVALTGQSGLFHASLPSINAKYRWFMLSLSSTFAVLNMTTTNYCIPHEYLVEIVEQARITNSTTMFKNRDIRGRATHADFAIYVAPQHKKYFFIGPYHINEELTCETLCYYKNMLVSTENFNKIHGNPEIPVGTWIKQLQMKIHSAKSMKVASAKSMKVASAKVMQVSTANTMKVSSLKALKVASVNTTKASPVITMKVPTVNTMNLLHTTAYLKPILPKPTIPSPPQLLRISDFMAAKKGKYAVKLAKEMRNRSPRTSLLIVNNNVVSSLSTTGVNKITVGSVGAMKNNNFEIVTPSATPMSSPVASPKAISSTAAGLSSASSPNNTTDDPLFINHNVNEDIRVLGLDYRDAEFIDDSHKTLQFLVSNIPGFGYIRIYRCQKTNYLYLMWRFVKMYKTLIEAKKSLIHLIESTVIIVPSNFKITITLLNAKPNNLKLINSDYYFDTYIAGRFGVHLLSNLNMSMMVDYLKINEADAAYIKEKSSGMLLKKCYNIASTFLTKDDLSKIRNWNDMMSSLKGTIDFERRTTVKLTDILRNETSKHLALQAKLDNLRRDSADSADIINITPVKATSEVIEISDDDDNKDDESKLQSDVTTEGPNAITTAMVTRRPMVQQVGEIIQTSNSNTITTNTQQRTVGFVSMAQNFKGSFKLMPHNQNSVLITRIKTQTATTKTNTNDL